MEIFSRSVKKVFVSFDNSELCCHCDCLLDIHALDLNLLGLWLRAAMEDSELLNKILINFQLIINCCFNEAFPFVIIYKINFDI